MRNAYLAAGDAKKVIAREVGRYTFAVRPAGTMLIWDSTITAGQEEVTFGEQEEMGLGVRVASAITEKAGESMHLRYGILLHSGPEDRKPDLAAAYDDFVGSKRQ